MIGTATIDSTDGELAGMTGTIRWNSVGEADEVSYQADLVVPVEIVLT